MIKPDTPHMNVTRRMRPACWETKAADTQSVFDICRYSAAKNG